jgi:hypothetical protein
MPSVPTGMSRHSLRPNDQIFRATTHSRKTHSTTAKAAAHVTIIAQNPILAPPSFGSLSLGRTAKADVDASSSVEIASSPVVIEAAPITNNFPSPMSRPGSSTMEAASSFGMSFRPSRSVKSLVLATVPGFFGVMGLGQFFGKRRTEGVLFMAAGAMISFLSSWYTILPERIYGLVSGGTPLPPYALSWMSHFTGYNIVASEFSLILLALVPAMWALQVYDSISPISLASPPNRMKSTLKVLPPTMVQAAPRSRQQIDQDVQNFAKDLMKTKSLVSYLWER